MVSLVVCCDYVRVLDAFFFKYVCVGLHIKLEFLAKDRGVASLLTTTTINSRLLIRISNK